MDGREQGIGTAGARGRGAATNRAGRFERLRAEAADDGWPGDGEAPGVLRTTVAEERPRRVITRNDSPDIGFDRSVNPYRGCEHGCIYCFARPTHAYLGFSPGLDFETRLIARPDAPAVLRRELAARGYVPEVIAIGTATDPYQPVEKARGIMRGLLAVLEETGHPVSITTKGALVLRDIDILGRMAARGLVRVGISVTTLDPAVARAMEPRVPPPARRLEVIGALAAAGVPVRVMVSPVIPALTDHEVEGILAAAADAGARAASAIMLRLPGEVAEIWREWLEATFPGRAARVMARLREVHGGRDYDPAFGLRMQGQGEWARLFAARFQMACRRLGLNRDLPALRTDLFLPPRRADDGAQLSLF